MKRIAIIDNTSSHIKKLQSLVSEYDTTTIPYGDCSRFDFSRFDLIILSGGREYSLIGNEKRFGSEIELIKKINRPIIGVCFGFQLIAYVYDGWIIKLPKKVRGLKKIRVSPKWGIGKDEVHVYENHSWSVETLPICLESLAVSPSGVEIFRHAVRPVYGMQFHPEVRDGKNDGIFLWKKIMENLLQ